MIVLGIETSCDETGVALFDGANRRLIADRLFSQIDMHAEYGGVVPELASRDHVRRVLPMVRSALAESGVTPDDIDGIAYTRGPGLVGALLVGATVAHTLAEVWAKPVLGVHHMEGHLLAPLLEENPPEPPFVALLVSGGHTQLVAVDQLGDYRILGESLDDAAGEAFDKTAKLLGLPYPGGPAVARLAVMGDAGRYRFPRPMTDRPGLDFSFSGLKTFTMNKVKEMEAQSEDQTLAELEKAHIAAAFEMAVVDTLVIKCRRAIEQTGFKQLVLAGGVAANQMLRERINVDLTRLGAVAHVPRKEFCTDNGAMIAFAGALRLMAGERSAQLDVEPRPALEALTTIGY